MAVDDPGARDNDLGAASWRSGVPISRTADAMLSLGDGCWMAVRVCTALGVGGANPPVIPRRYGLYEWKYAEDGVRDSPCCNLRENSSGGIDYRW